MLHEYVIVARRNPTQRDKELNRSAKVYRMRLFAPNEVFAKSRFWNFMRTINKLKKCRGEIVSINEVFEKSPHVVKNYGILLRYRSSTGEHNMWKEFRDVTRCGAVEQVYKDMAGRHRATYRNIQIIDVQVIPSSSKKEGVVSVKRTNIRQFHDSKIKFPLPHRIGKSDESKRFSTKFKHYRPNTYFG